jgi:ABC-type transport system involved in multi-copper enzyme maturation permease subunit
MKPLLWKEIHDLRAWLLAGAVLMCSLEALLLAQVFDGSFVGIWMEVLMPLAAAATAISLGAGQIARERHIRTLDFLLVRPVSAGVIVWSKFAAGTIVLSLLLTGVVALGYADPEFTSDTGLRAIREQVRLGQLLTTLLPRFWFLYAIAFFFSVLVDRSVKAAALTGIVAITVVSVAFRFAEIAPFSGFVYWLPFFDQTGGLVEAAKNSSLAGMTGLVYSCGAIMLTAISARFLKRSPERYLGNLGLAAAAGAVIAIAVVSSSAAANRLPVRRSLGSLELQSAAEWDSAGILAAGRLVALSQEHNVRFLDFTQPSRPRQIADVEIPLWNTSSDWSIPRAAMEDDTVFLVGEKKQLPADDVAIAIVGPSGLIDTISLGPARTHDYTSAPIPAAGFIYVGVTRDRVCSLLTFDRASRRLIGSLLLDGMRPQRPGTNEGSPPVRMLRRGAYLYVSSPSYLTAISIADPARPMVASQVPVLPKVSFLYGFPRPLAWQDNRLFDLRIFPPTLASYSLNDPAHPTKEAELTYHDMTMKIYGAGHTLYKPWRSGVMEFRADGGDLHAQRYFRGNGSAVSDLANAGDYIYALTGVDSQKRRTVNAFLAR